MVSPPFSMTLATWTPLAKTEKTTSRTPEKNAKTAIRTSASAVYRRATGSAWRPTHQREPSTRIATPSMYAGCSSVSAESGSPSQRSKGINSPSLPVTRSWTAKASSRNR
jgi:hypothetical protein